MDGVLSRAPALARRFCLAMPPDWEMRFTQCWTRSRKVEYGAGITSTWTPRQHDLATEGAAGFRGFRVSISVASSEHRQGLSQGQLGHARV
jgi:hypothetical protein